MQPGDLATWLHRQRGGYRWIQPVDAVVVRTTPRRVLIEVSRATGERVQRWVTPDRLRLK
jgi:hypothetical protein